MSCVPDCYSDYLRDKINDHVHGGPDYTRPTTTYWALMTTMPAADGSGGVEVSGGGYARVAITNNSTNWPASVSTVKQNASVILWPTPTASWGTVVGICEYDASTSGNLMTFSPPTFIAVVTASGVPVQIDANGISLTWAA